MCVVGNLSVGAHMSETPSLGLGGPLLQKWGGAALSPPWDWSRAVPGNSSRSCQAALGSAQGLTLGTE